MKKFILYSIGILAFLISLFFLVQNNISLRRETKRLSQNQISLSSEIEHYKIDSARNAASIYQLRLTKEELQELNSDLASEVESLNLKLKNINSVSKVEIESSYDVKTPIKDSIIFKDSSLVKFATIDYVTPFISLKGTISNNEFKGTIKTFDFITRVEHRVPKKFLFFTCGTKFVKEEYFSSNPHTVITGAKSVIIVDKKGRRKDR